MHDFSSTACRWVVLLLLLFVVILKRNPLGSIKEDYTTKWNNGICWGFFTLLWYSRLTVPWCTHLIFSQMRVFEMSCCICSAAFFLLFISVLCLKMNVNVFLSNLNNGEIFCISNTSAKRPLCENDFPFVLKSLTCNQNTSYYSWDLWGSKRVDIYVNVLDIWTLRWVLLRKQRHVIISMETVV